MKAGQDAATSDGDPVGATGRDDPASPDLDHLPAAAHDEPGPSPGVSAADRAPALRLARIHLRGGSVDLSLAELEHLASIDGLDREGWLDLAEARWRAGRAADAAAPIERYQIGGGDAPLGDVIGAEAATARGRPSEARRLAERALLRLTVPLDVVFAGQPRSAVWPTSPEARPAEMLFPDRGPADPESGGPASAQPFTSPGGAAVAAGFAADGIQAVRGIEDLPPGPAGPPTYQQDLWAEGPASPGTHVTRPRDLLAAAAAARDAGDDAGAATRYGLALRLDPSLAPVVLGATGAATGPALAMVRGDAHRILGDAEEAARAYRTAAAAIGTADPDWVASGQGTALPTGAAEPGGALSAGVDAEAPSHLPAAAPDTAPAGQTEPILDLSTPTEERP